MSQARILPLLIFVAMLAFSVRLADVAIGISSFNGGALASEAKPAEHGKTEEKKEEKEAGKKGGHGKPEEVVEEIPLPPPIEGPMDSDKSGALQFTDGSKEKDSKTTKEKKDIEWKDASEMEMESSESRVQLENDLVKRRVDLEKREKEMLTREALLKTGEQELEKKFTELSQLRGEIEKLLKAQSDAEDARVTSLVKIYEGMKPADAARIFNTLDLDILVSVMSRMSERKLSPVLAAMDSERAKTVTIMLAEQKQLPQLPPSN